MRLIYIYIISSLLFGSSENPHFDIFPINEPLMEQLERGEIVVIKTDQDFGDAEHYQVYGLIDADVERIFKAIDDFDDYPKFMPRFEKVDETNDANIYIFNIILPLNIKYKYKIKTKKWVEKPNLWLAWETIEWEENSIEETWGQWYLEPYNNQTLIHYQIYTDPGYIPFGFGWIVDVLTKNSLPEIVKNLKEWTENNEN